VAPETRVVERGSAPVPRADLLRIPGLGGLLKRRWIRPALQLPLFLLAAVLVLHGFFGPQLAPKNLATVLTWVHFRGLLVFVLLAAGNLFCLGCPLLLPRELARKQRAPPRAFPPALWASCSPTSCSTCGPRRPGRLR
jgi:hypothetical protein